jgi:uncharacterized protein YqeY
MSLKEQIEADIKKAMLAKEKDDLRALRGIKSMILLALSEPGASENLSADVEMKILQKAAKQRADSLTLYRDQNRNDLAEIEEAELEVIKRYLPEQLSGEELEGIVSGIIEKTGASSMKDMGKVMGMASKELAGKADGKTISGIVKKLLS